MSGGSGSLVEDVERRRSEMTFVEQRRAGRPRRRARRARRSRRARRRAAAPSVRRSSRPLVSGVDGSRTTSTRERASISRKPVSPVNVVDAGDAPRRAAPAVEREIERAGARSPRPVRGRRGRAVRCRTSACRQPRRAAASVARAAARRRRPARDRRASTASVTYSAICTAMPASSSRTTGTSRGNVGTREQRVDARAEIEDRAADRRTRSNSSAGGFQTIAKSTTSGRVGPDVQPHVRAARARTRRRHCAVVATHGRRASTSISAAAVTRPRGRPGPRPR